MNQVLIIILLNCYYYFFFNKTDLLICHGYITNIVYMLFIKLLIIIFFILFVYTKLI